MSEETQDRRQKAAKAAQREARLAEEMKANMRKRKGQKKSRAGEVAEGDNVHEEGENEQT